MHAQSDDFDFGGTTQAEFDQFSRLFAQGMYATPVEPATSRGFLAFDVGVALTAVPVDTEARYWSTAVKNDFTVSDHFVVPKLVASKGLSIATVSASYAKVQDSDISIIGGAIDVPLISGGIAVPSLTVRGAYSQLGGADNFEAKSMGVEVFIAKGFGPITPYAAVGRMRADTTGQPFFGIPTVVAVPPLTHESDFNRYTAGVRISLAVPKIVVEVTQAEERSYAAKISVGLF